MSSNTVMGEQNICQLKNLNYIFFAIDKKRKTKWDNQPSSNVTGSRGGLPGVIHPSVVNGSPSGTKSTVMPAVGNI
jgi:hypothetical protein